MSIDSAPHQQGETVDFIFERRILDKLLEANREVTKIDASQANADLAIIHNSDEIDSDTLRAFREYISLMQELANISFDELKSKDQNFIFRIKILVDNLSSIFKKREVAAPESNPNVLISWIRNKISSLSLSLGMFKMGKSEKTYKQIKEIATNFATHYINEV